MVRIVGLPTNDEGSDDGEGAVVTMETGRGYRDFAFRKARTLMATSRSITGLQKGELVERHYDSDDLGEVIERKPDDQDAIQKRIIGAEGEREDASISVDSAELREATPAALPPKQAKRRRVDEKDDGSTLPLLPSVDRKSEVIDQELTGGKSKLATDSARERGKTKQGMSRVKAKKGNSKNAIDNLFAGLT